MKRNVRRITSVMPLLLAALLLVMGVSNPSYASTTVYTSESSFLSAIKSGYYLEDFPGWVYQETLSDNPTTYDSRTVNGYSWRASATDGLYSYTNGISTYSPPGPLTVTFTGNPVTAVGGIFAATDLDGYTMLSDYVAVSLSDSTSLTFTGSSFYGFVSTTPITSLTVSGVREGVFPAMYNFYTGSAAAPVPIPPAFLLMGSGLAGLGLLRRRFFRV